MKVEVAEDVRGRVSRGTGSGRRRVPEARVSQSVAPVNYLSYLAKLSFDEITYYQEAREMMAAGL